MAKKKNNIFNYQNNQNINNFMASVNAVRALHQKPTCEVCGEEYERDMMRICGTYDRFDFFGRPNFRASYEVCPHCGYTCKRISKHIGGYAIPNNSAKYQEHLLKLKELVDSDSYKSCKGIVEIASDSYKRLLYHAFLCYQVKENKSECAYALLRLVWEMDETYMKVVEKTNNDSNEVDPDLSKINFETLTDEERQDLIKSKETIFKWVLEDYFKYVGEIIDKQYDQFKNASSEDLDYFPRYSMDGYEEYIEILINYIYYQRRFGDINEAENKLNILNEIKKNINSSNKIRGGGLLLDKVNFFYEIEYANIQLIKYNKPIDPYLLTKAFKLHDSLEHIDYIFPRY